MSTSSTENIMASRLVLLVSALVIGVTSAICTYLWQARSNVISIANMELEAKADEAMARLLALTTAASTWGQALERYHTFHALDRSANRDTKLSGHIVDIVDQNPALAAIAITDATGAIQFASDGTPGLFPYLLTLPVPPSIHSQSFSETRLFGNLESAIAVPFAPNAKLQIWRPVDIEDMRMFYVFYIDDASLAEITRIRDVGGAVSTSLIRQDGGETALEFLHLRTIRAHPLMDGHNTVVAWLSLDDVLATQWQPKALIGIGATILLIVLTGILFVVQGTYHRRAQRAETSETKLSTWLGTLLSAAPDAILVVSQDQRIQVANNAAHDMFGWPAEALNGQTLDRLVPGDLQTSHTIHASDFFVGGKSLARMGDYRKVRGKRQDGVEFPIMVSLGFAQIADQRFAIAIARDMTSVEAVNNQLTKLSLELSAKLVEAEAASAAKLRFLASMSHELRTPLNAIIGFSDVLSADTLKLGIQPTYRDYAKDIYNSGTYLLKLINDILEVSKLGMGKVSLNTEVCTVADLIDLPVKNLTLIAKNSEVDVQVSVSQPPGAVYADTRAVRQCIFNVLSNAIKFSPPFNIVTMAVAFDETTMHISIEDNGPGISQEDLPRIVRPFERGQDPYTGQQDGAGLGLAITKDLLDLMGGQLHIRSELGKGTEVLMSFPITKTSTG